MENSDNCFRLGIIIPYLVNIYEKNITCVIITSNLAVTL